MGLSQFDERKVNNGSLLVQHSDGTNDNNVWSAGAYGSHLDQILITHDDTIDHVLTVGIKEGSGNVILLGSVTVPAIAAGVMSTIEAFNAISGFIPNGLAVDSQATVVIAFTVALSSGKFGYLSVFAGDF